MQIPILSILAALVMSGLAVESKERHDIQPVAKTTSSKLLTNTLGPGPAKPKPLAEDGAGNMEQPADDTWHPSQAQAGIMPGLDSETAEIELVEPVQILFRKIRQADLDDEDELNDLLDSYIEEWFGYSVAISGDGLSAIIGIPNLDAEIYEEDADGNTQTETNCGGVAVYTRICVTCEWSQMSNYLLPVPTTYEEEEQVSLDGINFGYSVALSDDGLLALIGAPYYSYDEGYVEDAINCGTAYLFSRVGPASKFSFAHQFLPFNDDPDAHTGVYDEDEEEWTKPPTEHNDTAYDWFGISVDIYKYLEDGAPNPRVIIGAMYDKDDTLGCGGDPPPHDGNSPGAAYIFNSSNSSGGMGSWDNSNEISEKYIYDDDGSDCYEDGGVKDYGWFKIGFAFDEQDMFPIGGYAYADLYGWSVGIERDYAIVGAPQYTDMGAGFNVGRVFVYKEIDRVWELQEALPDDDDPDDPFDPPHYLYDRLDGGDEFGSSVSITRTPADPLGQTPGTEKILVGAPKDGYGVCCFGTTCEEGWEFDDCVNAGGNTVFLGGISECTPGSCDPDSLQREWGPCCIDTYCEPMFAYDCIWIYGGFYQAGYDTCAEAEGLCDEQHYGLFGDYRGSAYIFRESGNWILEQQLYPEDGVWGSWFGSSVSIKEDGAVVGAPKTPKWICTDGDLECPGYFKEPLETGAAYFFHREDPSLTWERVSKLTSLDPDNLLDEEFGVWGAEFGRSVSIAGGFDLGGDGVLDDYWSLVGAPYHDDIFWDSGWLESYNAGTAYSFELLWILDP